ncbi:MAG TPA: protein kinase [Kofleriaceae bacterium]|nr:protein kinase [Kofleriaceae bacterium]
MADTCQEFDALIARRAQLTAQEAAVLEAHLAGCGSCRELARALKPLSSDFAFAATGASDTLAGTPGRVDHPTPEVAADRYRITGEVGRGGIGRVLEALDRVLDRPVALKELFSASDALRRRFVREALITARLQHPSIVPIYDAGHLDDRSPFYAMKLVAGQPLDKSIAEATTLTQRLALLPSVLAIADAMAYAHSKRIIHRDLKPSNVLVGAFGETIVIDWGLAKDLRVDDHDALDAGPYRAAGLDHTVAGAVLGTPTFMAPEQAAGEPVDERADVYALGAILYHVVSGKVPHEGTTLDEMVHRVIAGDVRPLTERAPEVPRDLAAIVTKAMALAPSERYANGQGFVDDLRSFLTGQLVGSYTYRPRELLRRWVKRHRAAVIVALTAFVVVAVVGVSSVMRIVQARREADSAAAVATEQRSIAEQQRNSATQRLATLLVEQGRQELLAGRPARAAAYLSEAHAQAQHAGVALRFLLATAMRSVEAQRISFEHGDEIYSAAFSPDGLQIVTAGADGIARVWDSISGRLVATLSEHDRRIKSASFSFDNARIVTASTDRTARVWDARTGTILATMVHPYEVLSAAFSPDGARVVATGDSRTAAVWDATTGKLIATLAGHHKRVYSAAVSADGAHVVTASEDHTAKLWDARTGELLHSLAHRGEVVSAAFSPDGSQVATASDDQTAGLWSARTGALVASLVGHTGHVHVVGYSPDGTRIVTGSDDRSAKLWDARTGKLLASLDGHDGAINAAAFNADGTRVATASNDRTTKLWDARTGKLLASFEGHRDRVGSVSFSPNGTQILTASADGAAKLWDAAQSDVHVALAGSAAKPANGALSPDGAKLVTTVEGGRTATLWNANSGQVLASLGHRAAVTAVSFDAVGVRVATASADRTAKLWDAKTGKLLVSLDHTDAITSAAFTADGARLVTSSADRRLWIWNAASGALIAKLDGSIDEYPVRVSKDGTRVLTANMYGAARIKSVDTGTTIVELDGNTGPVYAAGFDWTGDRVVTVSLDRTAKVWNARTGKIIASFAGGTGNVLNTWFSPDGARFVTAADDHTATLWDAATGKLLASYEGHKDTIVSVSFSPDPGGDRVLTTSADHTAKLWDQRTGKLLASFDRHTDGLLDARFSTDGTRVITASRDGSIWFWDTSLEQREPDAIRDIISARDPWALSNGVLVPR